MHTDNILSQTAIVEKSKLRKKASCLRKQAKYHARIIGSYSMCIFWAAQELHARDLLATVTIAMICCNFKLRLWSNVAAILDNQ